MKKVFSFRAAKGSIAQYFFNHSAGLPGENAPAVKTLPLESVTDLADVSVEAGGNKDNSSRIVGGDPRDASVISEQIRVEAMSPS